MLQEDNIPTPLLARRSVWILLSLAVMAGVAYLLMSSTDTVDVEQIAEPIPAQLVTVERIEIGSETVRINVFGEIKPRWSAEVRSAVSGRILQVEDHALAGESVDAGDPLFSIEKTQFEAEVANANLVLSQAELSLLQAQYKTELAQREFKRDGVAPPTDLAVFLPQLQIAKLSVVSARQQLVTAQKRVSDADVTAPFSGIVTERFVSLGQSVSTGDRLVKLVDDENFELVVEMNQQNWRLMQHPVSGQTAEIHNESGKIISSATVRQGGGFLNESTRQYRLFLDLPASDNGAILSGDFVKVVIPGRTIEASLKIPETALTREGYIWFVDDQDRLQRHSPTILFREKSRIIIAVPEGGPEFLVAATPLASFLPGQTVQPLESGE